MADKFYDWNSSNNAPTNQLLVGPMNKPQNNGLFGMFGGSGDSIFADASLGDYGDLISGVGGLATGLYGMFNSGNQTDMYGKALEANIAQNKRTFNANATQYNHQVGRADGYNARHGVGPSEKIEKYKLG